MQCAGCKGKGLCGLPKCPVLQRFYAQTSEKPVSDYMGPAPSVLIGSGGYPRVVGGPLLLRETDLPTDWISDRLSIDDIVRIRSRSIRGSQDVRLVLEKVQEVALSGRPLDVEARFARPISFDLSFDGTVAPVGLAGQLKKIDILDNAVVEPAVDRYTSDTDLLAADAVTALHRDNVDVYRIANLLTAGLLGSKRRFVPTRWSITAVDDMISRDLRRRVERLSPLSDILVFSATLYGNTIVVLLIPSTDFFFEMIERWQKHSLWGKTSDVVVSDGEKRKKKGYSPLAGAYYSARLAVLEYLESRGRTARALVIRDISGDYWAPLGTWVIREATRAAMQSDPICCPDRSSAEAQVTELLGSPFWYAHADLLREIRFQKTFADFA
ncbi:MAG: hypothetical protein D5R99_08915 [Methanocalculus sp. MSAO_Arc1]|uniref:hypothetical protein n=1 Tax=Methanocalculus TaxID=71151 RepID=UPI000FEF5242|nr:MULTISPECIES: hypothetical protein [unclassified Methanocalculus]RQD79088.1 MAG: hypothetical protein D5R99_08915 [Methanocalculus sp. MSAO_Arc1]